MMWVFYFPNQKKIYLKLHMKKEASIILTKRIAYALRNYESIAFRIMHLFTVGAQWILMMIRKLFQVRDSCNNTREVSVIGK